MRQKFETASVNAPLETGSGNNRLLDIVQTHFWVRTGRHPAFFHLSFQGISSTHNLWQEEKSLSSLRPVDVGDDGGSLRSVDVGDDCGR